MTSAEKNILWLLSAFDSPRTLFFHHYYHGDLNTWQPQTREEKECFNQLTTPANRAALKAWYGKMPFINPVADAFRQLLEKAINENLPLGLKPENGSRLAALAGPERPTA